MKLFVMLPEPLWNTPQERFLYGVVETLFRKEEMLTSHKHKEDGEVKLFDIFCDCKLLIVHPYNNGTIDKKMRHAVRVFVALNKPVYLMNAGAITICQSLQLQDKCHGQEIR